MEYKTQNTQTQSPSELKTVSNTNVIKIKKEPIIIKDYDTQCNDNKNLIDVHKDNTNDMLKDNKNTVQHMNDIMDMLHIMNSTNTGINGFHKTNNNNNKNNAYILPWNGITNFMQWIKWIISVIVSIMYIIFIITCYANDGLERDQSGHYLDYTLNHNYDEIKKVNVLAQHK